ncbi:MAG: NAD(P)-binding protein [Deltaproteobacteria bacterium]|nr:NAD(P)-binding protein [Deltaproteobacteria bacterium]
MRNQFKAIIVGSGLGGLTVAATLAKNRHKVAVFERHSQPGGYATTFFRDGFEFEVSLHAMSGVGTPDNPGPLRTFYDALGILDKVNFIPLPDLYRTMADGVDITIPRSPANAESVLISAFPDEAAGIHSFIQQIVTVGKEVQLIREGGYGTSPLPTLARFPNLAHAAGTTVSDVMNRYISNDNLKLVLGQLWGYFGLPPDKLSFLLFAAGVSSYLTWGAVTIEGKSQSLSNAYADVIRENGGEVHLSEGIQQILVENGRVCGVVSDKGDTFFTDTVISNADPYSTLTRLIDRQHIQPKHIRRLEAAAPSAGTVTLYLGLNRPTRELGIHNHELYINLETDMNKQWESCGQLCSPGVVSVCAYDIANPSFARKGKGVLAITILQQGEVWTSLNDAEYAIEKERYGKMLLKIVAERFPAIRDAIETQIVSTPVSNVRYTGNPQGAIYGFANTPEENPGFRMDNKGPLEGLWFAGAWTRPSAGYQGVITSGYNTAMCILEQWGEVNELPYGIGASQTVRDQTLQRRLNGWKLMFRDGKRVGKVIRSKYRKYDNSSLEEPFISTYDKSARFHAANILVKVTSRKVETADTVTLRLFPEKERFMHFRAGQYMDVTADIRGQRVTRAYSISSAPENGKYLDITVKAQPGGNMSRWLVNDVRVGDRLSVTGPFGDFVYVPERDTKDIVAIAVGSGITPIMSMLREFDGSREAPRVHLVYGARHEADLIFKDEINEVVNRNPNIRLTHILSRPSRFWKGRTGRVSVRGVLELFPDNLDRKTYFICGPPTLYRPLVDALRRRGVSDTQIRYESFRTGTVTKLQMYTPIPDALNRMALFKTIQTDSFVMCHLIENPGLIPSREPTTQNYHAL